MSITSSYVILFVIVIRFLLKKAPNIYSYILWAVVYLRLIIPISFESIFSLIPMSTNTIPQDIVYTKTPEINSGLRAIDGVVNNSLPKSQVGASVNPMQVWISFGQIIWIIGILALTTYTIISTVKLYKRLKTSRLIRDNIYETDIIEIPFVFGIIKPKIYIPSGLSETEKEYIIKHEERHIKRYDHIIRFIAFIITSIHWLNPLVWVAYILMSKDMELSCDEAVIKEMGNSIKKDYSISLLKISTSKRIPGRSPLAFGGKNTKSRIKNILNYKEPKFWVSLLGIIIISVTGIGLLSNPNNQKLYESTKANYIKIEEVSNIEIDEISGVSQDSIVAQKLTRLFKPKVTKLRSLSDEDYQLYDVIMKRLNAIVDQSDREVVYEIADEYGEDQEEFYEDWIEIANSMTYGNGNRNNTAILQSDMSQLQEDVIYENIVGEDIQIGSGQWGENETRDILTSRNWVKVDGEEYEISFKLKFSEDYAKAELIDFTVKGQGKRLPKDSEAIIIDNEEIKVIMIEDIKNKLLEGYEESSIKEINNKINFDIVEPKYLPERFVKYGIFIKDNPGIPNLKMVRQLWYDSRKNEVLMVTQMDGATNTSSEGDIIFTERLESQGTISDIYSWAKYRCQYEFIENEVSVQGYMLVNYSNDVYEYEEILKSLKNGN